jgi:hypothetical protein
MNSFERGPYDYLIGLNSKPPTGQLGGIFHNAEADEWRKTTTATPTRIANRQLYFVSSRPNAVKLAQTTPTPEKRTLYLKMASVRHQMAQRWEKKGESGW